ncbi:hypothetical protein LIER_29064 [Lithospermum erythrorhizon]|uniref:Uncharacterized protein n=1 Tax=Lithospermum erythrorhizon TaxID=34254 RepID=A0AAV3RIC2_LITER
MDEVTEDKLKVPLLENAPSNAPQKPKKTRAQKAVKKTCKSTANLSNLLPTGSVLAFQILAPVLTHQGHCRSTTSKLMTLSLVSFCGLCSFLLCFTDSCRDSRGKVRYGVATFKGLWIIDTSVTIPPNELEKYKLSFIDLVHGFTSFLVFEAVALFDQNIVSCFYPNPSDELKDFLTALPVIIGTICSILFVVVPSKRHGIGFPLSRE